MIHFLAMTLLAAVPSTAQQAFSPTEIPGVLLDNGSGESLRQGKQAGRAFLRATERRLTIFWNASALENLPTPPDYSLAPNTAHNAWGNSKTQSAEQVLPLRYYPTACCIADGTRILVGGISTEGATVIRRIEFSWPDPMPLPVTNTTTGIVSVAVALPSVSTDSLLYNADSPGRKHVRSICALRKAAGSATHALVLFHDSSDVYSIDLANGGLVLLASPTSSTGTLGLVSALNPPTQNFIRYGDRTNVGFTYGFDRGSSSVYRNDPTQPDLPHLILLDSDRNGEIESVLALSTPDYYAQEWHALQSYANWWLY